MKKVVKLTLEEQQIALLDHEAQVKGVHRADIIRDRLFDTEVRKFSPQDLAALVSRVNRISNIPRAEVERIVHKVFVEVSSGPQEAASPVLQGCEQSPAG